ncbi:MAG: nucleotidyl transferase AbiEii/AbiGii toxin family protein [Planctomycetota bacterium]
MTAIERVLRSALTVLADAGVESALVGGLAVSTRLEPRFTRDIDLAVAVDSDAMAERLVASLLSKGYRLLSQVEQEETGRLATVRLMPPGQGEEGIVLDLLFATTGIEGEIVHEAGTIEVFPNLSLPVADLPHLAAMKVLSEDGSRPQDRVDLLALLREMGPGDLEKARSLLGLIHQRGYARGRDLLSNLDELT